VNRSITEGRARFLKVFSRLEEGEECAAHEAALSALASGTATSADVVSIRPHLRHCATCRATVRDMRFSRRRRLALLLPFGWLARLVARPEVAMYASGGGRFGPAAAVLGICLSGGVAGAACVMTGALPAPPIIAHVSGSPKPPEAVKRVMTKKRTPAKTQVAKTTPTPAPPAARVAVPTATATVQRVKTIRKSVKSGGKRRHPVAAAERDEFTFEGAGSSGGGADSPPRASASSLGGSGGGTPSGGGGGGSAKPASSSGGSGGGEFGFEGDG
jgi:hypothetical protein